MGIKGLVLLQCAGVEISKAPVSLALNQASLLFLLLAISEADFFFFFLPGWFSLLAGRGYPFSQEYKETFSFPSFVSRKTHAYSPLARHAW
jgi:hypothetical protein